MKSYYAEASEVKYIIVTPRYNHGSAGIRALSRLYSELTDRGYDAMIATCPSLFRKRIGARLRRPIEIYITSRALGIQKKDDIVVYPEFVIGNPFGVRKVVRYILNVPGKLGGDRKYASKELTFAYNSDLVQYSEGRVLHIPVIESFFTVDSSFDNNRPINSFWVGKGQNTNHPVTKNCTEITRKWPADRKTLAELLKQTKIFYTYDDFTSLAVEAKMCGCEVKLIKGNKVIDYPYALSCNSNEESFSKQFDQFLFLTGKL